MNCINISSDGNECYDCKTKEYYYDFCECENCEMNEYKMDINLCFE